IRVHWCRPMRNEEIASWDLGQMHMGRSGLGVGTVSEDPNRDGERGFDYLTSALVSSKTQREGCRASRGGFPYWGDIRAEREGTSSSPPVECMSAKNKFALQRCKLSRKELDEFLSSYSIPSEYRVILPTPTQTILDSPHGYIGLYTHCFYLANLRLPLNVFFCKAYDCESSVELFCGFFNLCKAGSIFKKDPKSTSRVSLLELLFVSKDDEDLTFLPKDFSPCFNTGSPSVSINTEPVKADEDPAVEPMTEPTTEPVNERVRTTANLGGSPKGDTFVVHTGGVMARIRERKCKIRGGSSRPPVKRKLASGSSTSRTDRAKAFAIKDDTPVLSIFDDDEGLKDCLELKDVTACHLKISAITPLVWKGFVDNHLDVDLLDLHDCCYARESAREEEYEGLRAKCEAVMTDFDKNPASLLALESKVASLEAEKANLKATKASLRQEIEEVKHDRREVVSKVVPYACMELFTVMNWVKGYRPSYEKEHTQASNNLATATFSWLNKYVVDASASMKALLSKKPLTLQKHVPSRTQMSVPSSYLATLSSAHASKPMSHPADIVKPSPSPNE
nr:hypothetical protein [Tanacetum cinerariifolium]